MHFARKVHAQCLNHATNNAWNAIILEANMYSMAVRTCPVNSRQHKFAVIADSAVNINCSQYGADGDV